MNTFAHENVELCFIDYYRNDENGTEQYGYLVTAANHPFWVKGAGEARADHLSDYLSGTCYLQLQDKNEVRVLNNLKIFVTTEQGVGWCVEDSDRPGRRIDFRNNSLAIDEERTWNWYGLELPTVDATLRQRVYNIEVEASHTYYVGDMGVLVFSGGISEVPT